MAAIRGRLDVGYYTGRYMRVRTCSVVEGAMGSVPVWGIVEMHIRSLLQLYSRGLPLFRGLRMLCVCRCSVVL